MTNENDEIARVIDEIMEVGKEISAALDKAGVKMGRKEGTALIFIGLSNLAFAPGVSMAQVSNTAATMLAVVAMTRARAESMGLGDVFSERYEQVRQDQGDSGEEEEGLQPRNEQVH